MKLDLAYSLNKLWFWKLTRSNYLVSIQIKLCFVDLMEKDRALWANSYQFDCAGTCDTIKGRGSRVMVDSVVKLGHS